MKLYDLIIIGGGPAGITAGIYAARKKLKTLLLCQDFIGQTGKAFLIENYPGFKEIRGVELAQKFEKHLKKFSAYNGSAKGRDIEIKKGIGVIQIIKKRDKNFKIQTSQDKDFLARTVIVATGRDPRPLEVSGEKEFLGKGVAYCVTCDAPLFRDKIVAVIGGGNSGFEASLELSKYCKKIYILHHRAKPKADELAQERVKKNKKIQVILNAKTKQIKGKNFVESIIYQDLETKNKKELTVQGVFIQIGYVPATSFVKALVDFNKWDEIKINPKTCATKTPGLFAAGDVTDIHIKQIITAAAEGCKAALSAYKYLQK